MNDKKVICKDCSSEDMLDIQNRTRITRKYSKTMKLGNVTHTESGTIDFYIHKYVCLECGSVFEVMTPEQLAKYHENKKYFVK